MTRRTKSQPALPRRVEKGYEWVNGRAVLRNKGAYTAWVGTNILISLAGFVRDKKCGHVFSAVCPYQLWPNKLRIYTATFIQRGRFLNEEVPEGYLTLPPDLAVEGVAHTDTARSIELRVDELIRAGSRLVWLLYPKNCSAWVLRKGGTAARLTGDAELSGEDVVPGFTCNLSTLFEDL